MKRTFLTLVTLITLVTSAWATKYNLATRVDTVAIISRSQDSEAAKYLSIGTADDHDAVFSVGSSATGTAGDAQFNKAGADIDFKMDGDTQAALFHLDASADEIIIVQADITTLQIGNTSVSSTAAELNILDGVTSTAAELNILDGVTATAAELNILDGVTADATELNILDGVTSTTAELNILDGVTADAAELNIIDGVTSTTAELNILDGVTSTTAELNILDGVTATSTELNLVDGYTGTTANLNTLTDDSMADALHRHSELSASDGTPNPAMAVGATGVVTVTGAADVERPFVINGNAGSTIASITNSHASAYGAQMTFSNVIDNNTNYFWFFGATAAKAYLYSDGDWQNDDNSYGGISDSTLKTNIRNMPSQVDRMEALQLRTWDWKDDNTPGTGVVAQEIEKDFPELVSEYAWGDTVLKGVNYMGFVPILLKHTQEQQFLIDSQQDQIDALTSRLRTVEAALGF